MQKITDDLRKKITPLLKQHDVIHAAVFGSFAHGTAQEDSDLDLLVEFQGEKSLLNLAALQLALEDLLGRDVDVLTYRALHPRIREKVLNEQVPIL